MNLPIEDRIDKLIDALSHPDEYSINKTVVAKIQKEIDSIGKENLNKEEKSKLLLAQALVHYQNGNDIEALDFANSAIKHGQNSAIAYDLIDSITGNTTTYVNQNVESSMRNPFYYIALCYANFANGSGRSRRAEFWYFYLYIIVGAFILGIIDVLIGTYSESTGYGLFSTLFYLGNAIPYIAVGVRRLHDTNKSGGWFFINLIPLLGWGIFLIFMLSNSDDGNNQYGPNPKFE